MKKRNISWEFKKLIKKFSIQDKEKLIALWNTTDRDENNDLCKELKFEREAHNELNKNLNDLAYDIIREANTLPTNPAESKSNLDIIKHLIKRLDIHQISLVNKQKYTNILLLVIAGLTLLVGIFHIVIK